MDALPASRPARGEARTGPAHRLFAWMLARGSTRYERRVEARKRALFRSLSGTVLEIGPGAGANLRFYPKGVSWIGVEPNVHLHPYLRREARRLGLEANLRTGTAERLEMPDGSVEAVVSTLVLCSVDDVARTLREILRVLKPGGRFLFIEHVAAPRGTGLRRMQRLLRPVWKVLADGCHPDRETWAFLYAAGFEKVDLEHFRVPIPLLSPHIAGTARKPEAPGTTEAPG